MTGKLVLLFSAEDDPASAAIRIYSHSEFSHVDGVLPDGTLLGARSDGGVQIRRPGYAPFSRVRTLSVDTDCSAAVYGAARSQIGKPYDWRAIAAFAFSGDWRNDDSWFCSELWAWALEQGGFFKRKLPLEARRITPGDLLLLLSPYADA